tara:strand:+ start:120 stop:497 length:378 start_codon:yes stop_codon:yes gene_type:complete
MKKIISTNNAPAAIGPYSQAVLSGDTLYCSGQIAINPKNGELITNNIEEETTQVMNNISAILIEANMVFSDVVKCTIYMRDMQQYGTINKIYSLFFNGNPPAREAVEVSMLPKNVNVEISIIAKK